MSTTVTMTLDEVREYKPSPEELEQFNKTQTTDFSDCPKLTKEELERFKPWYDLHPDWYDVTVQVKKADVHLKIDVDVLEALKAQGKGYQTRINAILRAAVLGRASPSPHKKGRRLPVSPATVYLTANATSRPPELGGYGFNLTFVVTPIIRSFVVTFRTSWYLYFQTSISSIKHIRS